MKSETKEIIIKKKHLLFALCIVATSLSAVLHGCGKDSTTGPGRNEDIRFPLAIGNQWVYRCMYDRTAITANDTTHESGTGEITWKVAALEEVLGQEAFRIEYIQRVTSGSDSGKVVTFRCWYAERDSVLVAVANDSTVGYAPFLEGKLYKPAAKKDAIYDWGVTVLEYPLTPGSEWKFLYSDKKKVEDCEQITVNGRKFNAARVVRNLELDIVGDNPDETWPARYISTQWFSREGLVRSTMTTEHTNGSKALEIHESFVQELVSYMLK